MGERLRVIVALADAFEGAAVYDGLLSAGFDPAWCSNVREVGDAMRAQPFDLVIADVSLALDGRLQSEGRARNPLTPIILIGDPGSRPVSWSGRTMHLTRPVDQAMLTCFVTMALHQDKARSTIGAETGQSDPGRCQRRSRAYPRRQRGGVAPGAAWRSTVGASAYLHRPAAARRSCLHGAAQMDSVRVELWSDDLVRRRAITEPGEYRAEMAHFHGYDSRRERRPRLARRVKTTRSGSRLYSELDPLNELGERCYEFLRRERAVAISIRRPRDGVLDQQIGITGRGDGGAVQIAVKTRRERIAKGRDREGRDLEIASRRVVLVDVIQACG